MDQEKKYPLNLKMDHHMEDVGRLLLEVENELKNLRTKGGNSSEALLQAEEEIRIKAELLRKVFANSTTSKKQLPALKTPPSNDAINISKPFAATTRQDPIRKNLSKLPKAIVYPKSNNIVETKNKVNIVSLGETVETIRGYGILVDSFSLHHFSIRKGICLTGASEFESFKKAYRQHWGRLSVLIEQMRSILEAYDVPIAYVKGQELVALAIDELEDKMDHSMLAKCLENKDQVMELLSLPGRRFAQNQDAAATCIQSGFRAYYVKQNYQEFRLKNAAATTIAKIYKGYTRRKSFVIELGRYLRDMDLKWNDLCGSFTTLESKTTVIHIPSLSFWEHLRLQTKRLDLLENLQITRILDCSDLNVVYIAPFELPPDVIDYYVKLLEMRGIPKSRLQIIYPENAHRFPIHFSLTKLLHYSPKALSKLRKLSVNAYIVPGYVNEEDRLLALEIGTPLLNAEPRVAAVFNSRSGAKQIFECSEVSVPIGVHDLYDKHQVYESLGKLVAANLDTSQWVLRPDDWDLNVIVFNTHESKLVHQLMKERRKYKKEFWSQSSVQSDASGRLEDYFSSSDLLSSSFLDRFTKYGGVIEAVPDNILSRPLVNLLIKPGGTLEIVSTHDLILKDHIPVGNICPQQRVPLIALEKAASCIAQTLFRQGVIGYVAVEFVAFWDNDVDSMRLWATDLKIGYSNALASYKLFRHLNPEADKVCLSIDAIRNSNLANFSHCDKYFAACRLHRVSYDIKSRTGLVFTLMDSLSCGVIGAQAIDIDLASSIQRLLKFLKFLKQVIGIGDFEKKLDGCIISDSVLSRLLERHFQ